MDANQLANALRQELARSPKKAAILGIGLLVALYFWAPLVWKWLPTGGSEVTEAATTQQLVVVATPAAAEPFASPAPSGASWKQLVEWMAKDQRLSTANYEDNWLDPFRVLKQETVEQPEPEDVVEREEPPAVDPSPAELGLVLNSTVVGPRLKLAQINGATFAEDSNVAVRQGSNAGSVDPSSVDQLPTEAPTENAGLNESVVFQLARVEVDYVILTRNGKSYELKMQRAASLTSERVIMLAKPREG